MSAPPRPLRHRLLAHALRKTTLIDRAARRFDGWREQFVLRHASPDLLDAFNDTAYSAESTYRTDEPSARQHLFDWEERLFRAWLPPAPARLLIGGAGGGRECLALAAQGYQVVGFEPVPRLLDSFRRVAARSPGIEALEGSYADVPLLRNPASGQQVDLAARPRFDAVLLGWISFSHGRSDRGRVDALRRLSALTDGPLLVSFFGSAAGQGARDRFSVWVGYYRELDEAALTAIAADAGLRVRAFDAVSSCAALEWTI